MSKIDIMMNSLALNELKGFILESKDYELIEKSVIEDQKYKKATKLAEDVYKKIKKIISSEESEIIDLFEDACYALSNAYGEILYQHGYMQAMKDFSYLQTIKNISQLKGL
mgnify:CR=1 FL=1